MTKHRRLTYEEIKALAKKDTPICGYLREPIRRGERITGYCSLEQCQCEDGLGNGETCERYRLFNLRNRAQIKL